MYAVRMRLEFELYELKSCYLELLFYAPQNEVSCFILREKLCLGELLNEGSLRDLSEKTTRNLRERRTISTTCARMTLLRWDVRV